MSKQLITSKIQLREDLPAEKVLRPTTLKEYIGQEVIRENITVLVESTKIRQEAADHVLLYGPPGLGKTTLAYIIATELGATIKSTSGPALERAGDLVAILTSLPPKSILFIDEIHRIRRPLEEILYPAMEDRRVDIILGKGPGAKSVPLHLSPFTLIGATTRIGALSNPLRDRFGALLHLDFYNVDELTIILQNSARQLGLQIDQETLRFIAERSRKTPRLANRILHRVRDYALAKKQSTEIDLPLAQKAVSLLKIDERGLNALDRKYLSFLIKELRGQPTGISTLAAALHEERENLEDVVEPYLLSEGLIRRTPQGRIATEQAVQHLNL